MIFVIALKCCPPYGQSSKGWPGRLPTIGQGAKWHSYFCSLPNVATNIESDTCLPSFWCAKQIEHKDFLSPGKQICKGKGNAALSMHQRIATSSWRPGIHLWYCKRGGGAISENSSKFGNPIVPKSSVWYFQQNRRRHIVKDRLLHFAFTAKLHPSLLNVEQSLTNNEIIVGTLNGLI